MATRKLSFEDEENSANKRQRVEGIQPPVAASFDSLNNDCLVHIMSFLSNDDMNTLAVCTRECRQARNSESLDQTRTATIICSRAKASTCITLCAALKKASDVLTTKYTRFKVIGLETLDDEDVRLPNVYRRYRIASVTALELALNPNEARTDGLPVVSGTPLLLLRSFFRNVTELVLKDMSFVNEGHYLNGIRLLSPNTSQSSLARLECHNVAPLYLAPYGVLNDPYRFREINFDNCCLVLMNSCDDFPTSFHQRYLFALGNDGNGHFILKHCLSCRRLSIKDTTWCPSYNADHRAQEAPLSQAWLVKMVRNLPALRWLRSDLSPENVAMLQQERPEIMFVSD